MSKTGQARVLTPVQFAHLLSVIQEHRHLEKNTALVQISFKLGLRVQEIALLQIKDVAELGPYSSGQRSFNAQTAEGCHPFHVKPATRTGARLPPIGA